MIKKTYNAIKNKFTSHRAENDEQQPNTASNADNSKLTARYMKAAKSHALSSMIYYKSATTQEKVLLLAGIHAAIFIPGNNFVGFYLMYDDARDIYNKRKNKASNTHKKDLYEKALRQAEIFNGVQLIPLESDYVIHHTPEPQEFSVQDEQGNLTITRPNIK